jgi:hypothetical protein
MLLASYKSTRPGIQGLANRVIRRRLRGPYSHSEIVFEPCDLIDDLMPDGSAAPGHDGSLWCVSSVAAERLPPWSSRRAGKVGGVRFKRIVLSPDRWDFVRLRGDARLAAVRGRMHEGSLYDWQQIAGYAAWLIPDKSDRSTCAELCAQLLGMAEPWRMDPCSLHRVAAWVHAQHDAGLSAG